MKRCEGFFGKRPKGLANRAVDALLRAMEIDFQERARWLARHILPYEPMLRSRLRRMFVYGMEVDDIVQEM